MLDRRGFVVLLAACLLWACSHESDAAVMVTDAESGCRVFVPDPWRTGTAHWFGSCENGIAAGAGVLVEYAGGKVHETFFGEVNNGRMAVGVIETPDGYRLARFVDGDPVSTDDRGQIVGSFRLAADAARAASSLFRTRGNSASAEFYAQAAKRLDSQVD